MNENLRCYKCKKDIMTGGLYLSGKMFHKECLSERITNIYNTTTKEEENDKRAKK